MNTTFVAAKQAAVGLAGEVGSLQRGAPLGLVASEPQPISALANSVITLQAAVNHTISAADRIEALLQKLSPVPTEDLRAGRTPACPPAGVLLIELDTTVDAAVAQGNRLHALINQLERLVG